jgi:hypothetical protein
MEAETQTEEEQVNIIEPRSGPITPMDIGNFAPGTDSLFVTFYILFFFLGFQ